MKDNSNPDNPANNRPRRIVKRVKPFSSWQILVDSRYKELGMSIRALTEKIATPSRRFEHTTVWAWLRSPEGVPPAETYSAELNENMAIALGISPEVLAEAFEESRRKLIISSNHSALQGPLSVLRMLFSQAKQETWTNAEIVKLIDEVRGR